MGYNEIMIADTLSPLARKILAANPDAYTKLVVAEETPPETLKLLDNVQPEQLLIAPAKSANAGSSLLAALWLWHDGLEQCHHIVQDEPSGDDAKTYSFWHAIMHRREGDFSNSKYWYARAASHPALQILAAQAGSIVHQAPADKSLLRLIASGWNPNALVDLVESVHRNDADVRHPIAVRLQQLEWNALFDFCARQ